MVVLEAIGLASKEIFDYNRENFKFDQEQRLKKDLSRVEMQIQRFDLFRQDIEDLVKLTVSKMDMYQLIGALFLGFTTTIYCEGRVNNPPNWFNGLYLLSVASSFVYLLLAVWLSMHASISSHSFGVRLRTRYVRLPIPSLSQIASLTAKLSDFENQGWRQVMRVPFATPLQQWGRTNAQEGGGSHELLGHGEDGFGSEDVVMAAANSLPGKHVHLYRRLQAKWQCYDAYARVAMSMGVHQMLNSLNYFMVGVNLIKWKCPSIAIACTIVFQSASLAIGILDVSGWSKRKVALLQLMGSLPIAIQVAILTIGNGGRGPKQAGFFLRDEHVWAPAAAYLAQGAWFLSLIHLAKPSKGEAGLPRRYRAVLFLDVFGDASYDPTEAEDAAVLPTEAANAPTMSKAAVQRHRAAAAESALSTAQAALRRWEAVPPELLSGAQRELLGVQRKEYTFWRRTFHGHQVQQQPSYDTFARDKQDLRSWAELSAVERREDEFAGAFLGPLEQSGQGRVEAYHYDLENRGQVWEELLDQPVLTLEELAGLVRGAKAAVQALIRKADGEAAGGPDADTAADDDSSDSEDESDDDSSDGGTSKSARGASRLEKTPKDTLPWTIIRRMTKVLAFCWMALGVELIACSLVFEKACIPLFNATRGIGSHGRRLNQRIGPAPGVAEALAEWDKFDELQVEWPHRGFFRPATLSCVRGPMGEGGLIVGTQYRLYSATHTSASTGLSILPRSSFPPDAVALCPSLRDSDGQPESSACLLGAVVQDGVAVWPLGGDPRGEGAVVLPVQGRPWRSLAGAAVPCAEAAALLPRPAASAWCLLLAGWDGGRLLLAAAPLPEGPGAAPPRAALAPRLDVPLARPGGGAACAAAGSCRAAADAQPAALHLDARQGRLWVLDTAGSLEAWDLYNFRAAGQWQLRWPRTGGFRAAGLCAESPDGLVLVGTDDVVGPRMFRAQGLVRSSLQAGDAGNKGINGALSKSGSNGTWLA